MLTQRIRANGLDFAYLTEGQGPLVHDTVDVPGGHFLHREHPERVIAELVRAVKG